MTGGVPLTLSVGIHVFSVMFALVFWMLSIYGMLRHPRVASKLRVFSGVIFGLVLLLGVLGPHGLPLGLLERLVLLILLGWQIVVSIFTYVKSFSLLI